MNKKTKKLLATVVIIAVLVFILVFALGGTKASADSNLRVNERKFFTSYVVKSDDCLWDIAGEYITKEYSDRNEYIREIASSNQLESYDIYPGQLIILPYYADAPAY